MVCVWLIVLVAVLIAVAMLVLVFMRTDVIVAVVFSV
jgi:hypothetical protein